MRRKLLAASVTAACLLSGPTSLTAAEPKTYQTTNLFQFGNPAIKQAGGATLYRSKQSLEMRIAAGDLDMNTSYTVWWVVFNNPSACVGGCGADDLGNPAVRASVFYAAGFVTGDTTTGNVTAHVEAGALPAGVDIPNGTVAGLDPGNGFGAEVHLVVRSHGITNPFTVEQQISSFNGGCNPTCANKEAARFMPVE